MNSAETIILEIFVTVLAEYDFSQTMRVSEYIRTEDAEGDRGYPGLVIFG